MAVPAQGANPNLKPEQQILNLSMDDTFKMLAMVAVGWDGGSNLFRLLCDANGKLINTHGKTLLFAAIAQGGAGTTELVAAQAAGIKIKVVSYVLSMSAAGTIKFTGTADLTGAMTVATNGTLVAVGFPNSPLFATATASALSIVSTTGAVTGHIAYIVEA